MFWGLGPFSTTEWAWDMVSCIPGHAALHGFGSQNFSFPDFSSFFGVVVLRLPCWGPLPVMCLFGVRRASVVAFKDTWHRL